MRALAKATGDANTKPDFITIDCLDDLSEGKKDVKR